MSELDQFAEPLRAPLRRFAARLQELDTDGVLAWTLFGQVVAERTTRPHHAVQSVLVLRNVDLKLLARLAAEGPGYAGIQLAPPLIMTPAFLEQSRDTFPLEFIEIQQQYFVVLGNDFFRDLKFEDRFVRLQCERELKALLIGLRQGLLAATGKEDRLAALQHGWVQSLLRTLRGMLWLKGRTSWAPAERVLDAIAELVKLPLTGIRRAIDNRRPIGWDAFQELYADAEALGTAVDGW